MNTVDYIETIDCGLCHEPVDEEDRAQVQGRSRLVQYIIGQPSYTKIVYIIVVVSLSMKLIEIVVPIWLGLKPS